MATYPIFSQDAGQRIAINPERVASIIEIEPGRVVVVLPDSGLIEGVHGRPRRGELGKVADISGSCAPCSSCGDIKGNALG